MMDNILTLSENLHPSGSLKLTDEDGCRLKSGHYRILYHIDDQAKKIFI